MVGGVRNNPPSLQNISIGDHASPYMYPIRPADSLGDIGLSWTVFDNILLAEIGRYQRAREVQGELPRYAVAWSLHYNSSRADA